MRVVWKQQTGKRSPLSLSYAGLQIVRMADDLQPVTIWLAKTESQVGFGKDAVILRELERLGLLLRICILVELRSRSASLIVTMAAGAEAVRLNRKLAGVISVVAAYK